MTIIAVTLMLTAAAPCPGSTTREVEQCLADDLARPGLSRLLDRLMVEIGHELARHLRDAPDGQRH